VLFALLFVGFAVAQGIGGPSVPSGDVATVKGVPDEIADVSEDEFNRAVERQEAESKLKKPPAPGTDKYEEIRSAALGELLDTIWIKGEAEDMDIVITDKQVEDELSNIKKQSFPSKGAYEKFLKESKFTQADVDARIEVQLLSTAIQEQVNGESPAPTSEEVESYYEEEKATQFTEEESRDVRLVLNKDKAEVEAAKKQLEKDHSPAGWKKAATKYSSDPTSKAKGGLQEGITPKFLKGELKEAIFGSATGELVGPVKFETNWFLIEVVKLNPPKTKSLKEVEGQIKETLQGEGQQEFFAAFVTSFQTKWQNRTYCADSITDGIERGQIRDQISARCANVTSSGRPANASEACYEADPKVPAKECPAVVTPISPALPGSVTERKPKGEPFPQRPQPETTAPEGEAGAEVPTGAPPQGE
jgi:parvulin-like peptidyl-prolyl isomerase